MRPLRFSSAPRRRGAFAVFVGAPATLGGVTATDHVGRSAVAASGVPGNPKWPLAPASMAWQGKTLGEICRQLKDPKRNGGRDLAEIVHHVSEDELVGWAWRPGGNRAPAPGTQQQFGELIKAWAALGAVCPD